MPEQTIWRGSPSQVVNLGVFVLCGILAALAIPVVIGLQIWQVPNFGLIALIVLGLALIPVAIAFWNWLKTRSDVYELTSERILHSWGIFSRSTDTLELYRVKDIRVEQPFFLRLFGRCNIVLHTSDQTNPVFVFPAMPVALGLQDQLRTQVEARRDAKRVREVDMGLGEP